MKDRDLVRLYWPVELRPAFDALFAIDDAMADVIAQSTQPALGAIKLAWWRERLQDLDQGKVPPEPRLQAAFIELLPRGISGAEMVKLEEGFAALLDPQPDLNTAMRRGVWLFDLGARLLGGAGGTSLEGPGRLYGAGQLKRRGFGAADMSFVTEPERIPRRLRPLTGMAALARRDVRHYEAEGIPIRAWTLLRHRVTGRY